MTMTVSEAMFKVGETSYPRFNRAIKKAGITPVARSGRGRGGGRVFKRSQLTDIRKALGNVRVYTKQAC